LIQELKRKAPGLAGPTQRMPPVVLFYLGTVEEREEVEGVAVQASVPLNYA